MINTNQLSAYIQNVGETKLTDNLIATSTLSDINQVFYANGINDNINTATDLSIRYVSEDEFQKAFTKDGAQIEPKTLYVVSADVINAYNTNIKNVASPVEGSDASNKEYVDSTIDQSKVDILNTTDGKIDSAKVDILNTTDGKIDSAKNDILNETDEKINSAKVDILNETDEKIDQSKVDILNTTDKRYVDLSSPQNITGKKSFDKGLTIGYNNQDTGNYCFGVGTDLIVGSYSWFFTGIDISTDLSTARIYLCAKQPRYPFPFCIFNGDKTKFRMCRNTIDLNDPSTLSSLSSSTWGDSFILPGLWKLSAQDGPLPPYRDDYSQLSIDLGDKYYEEDTTVIINKLSDYLDEAFTEDKSLSVYNLKENCPLDAEITMVNNWKIEYARCGKVVAVGDGYIDVKLTNTVLKADGHSFVNIGIDFTDLDYDDASLVFIDYPSMPGPSTEATYASMNVGNANKVLRRCSFAAGKENKTESDYCVALGRKAEAKHFASFVWAPATKIKSAKDYSFTIGLPGHDLRWHETRMLYDQNNIGLYVADNQGHSEPLPVFVWNCLTADEQYDSLMQQYQEKRNTFQIISKSHAELLEMRNTKQLKPGQQYRITDYVATTNGDMSSRSANHPFDIIVTADDEKTLNEHARAIIHDNDTYFAGCDLDAWDVWYCIDNDTNRFNWADTTNGKGVIYRLVDEFKNDVPYDFKGIQFLAYSDEDNVYRYTFDSGEDTNNTDLSLNGTNEVHTNKIEPYYNVKLDKSGNIVSNNFLLNRIVFKGIKCCCNTFGSKSRNNTFGSSCYNNTFGSECHNNTFGNECHEIKFGSYCHTNTFGTKCIENTFDSNCYENTFGSGCTDNTFGPNCNSNTFKSNCHGNTFSKYCYGNIFGSSCSGNTLGTGCSKIKFGTETSTKSYCGYIRVDSGNKYLYINPTSTTSNSQYYQNVEIKEGVNDTTTYKTINDPNVGQTFLTTYKPTNSQEISI